MRTWLFFIGVCAVALMAIWSLAGILPERLSFVTSGLYSLLIIGAGLGSLAIRKHSERTNRTAREGSVEREISQRAASGIFPITLVGMTSFGLYLVLQDQFVQAFVLYVLIMILVAAYWTRYALIKRQFLG
jgi:hypothetical protein